MPTAHYNPDGGAIIARALFSAGHVMAADYELLLRQKASNATTTLKTGDNLNPEDDSAALPLPPHLNEGRRVLLRTAFVAHDGTAGQAYHIRLEIFQDGRIIGEHEERGTLTGKGQFALLFVELLSADASTFPA